MKKIIYLSMLFISLNTAKAEPLDLTHYSDCVGLEKNTQTLFNIKTLPKNLIFNRNGNEYLALPIFDDDQNYCILINEDKKKIIDVYPSMWKDSCLGEWDHRKIQPTWIATNNGGNQDTFSILISENLKVIKKLSKPEMKETLNRFKCIYMPYQKKDIVEINNVAFYLGRLGYGLESIELLNEVLKLDPNRVAAYFNLYESYKRLGIYDKSELNLIKYRHIKSTKN